MIDFYNAFISYKHAPLDIKIDGRTLVIGELFCMAVCSVMVAIMIEDIPIIAEDPIESASGCSS